LEIVLLCPIFISVIEESRLVIFEVERLRLHDRGIECAHYVDDPTPYAPLLSCSYWGYNIIVFHSQTHAYITQGFPQNRIQSGCLMIFIGF
jgi:pullulanase/glycogen debranching enzyme